MELAPISVVTYHRLEHLKKTIKSLQQNTLAKKSILYIFSDAPKEGDEEIVSKVRDYLHTIDGFKEVNIIEQESNDITKNLTDALEIPLKKFGKIIAMEDDNITAPGFLQFINDGLEYYKDDKRILSIAGHTSNLSQLKLIDRDFYITRRFHPWGFGIWESRYKLIESLPNWEIIKKNKVLKKEVNQLGSDLWGMIKSESVGKINATDIKLCYLATKRDMYNILPTQTLVKNIGLDGSGIHCGNNDPYSGDILSDKIRFTFSKEYNLDDKILKEYKSFYNKPLLYERVIRKMKNIFNRD